MSDKPLVTQHIRHLLSEIGQISATVCFYQNIEGTKIKHLAITPENQGDIDLKLRHMTHIIDSLPILLDGYDEIYARQMGGSENE